MGFFLLTLSSPAGFYPEGSMPANMNYAYQQTNGGTSSYYAPSAAPGGPPYGNTAYYPGAGDMGGHTSYSKAAGYPAMDNYGNLNHFIANIKERNFDPQNYAAVQQQLSQLQNFHLPPGVQHPMPAYANGPPMAASYGPAVATHGPYSLPPLDSLRTKNELENAQEVITTMIQAAYEHVGT
jgi:hypothetical protein